MRIVLLFFCLLFVCSCAGGKSRVKAPEKLVETEEAALPAPVPPEALEKAESPADTEDYSHYTFTTIVLKEGIPFANITPRAKEQVAIYKKNDHFTFYYLRENKLISKKDYSFPELDKIKAESNYPEAILKDLGAM